MEKRWGILKINFEVIATSIIYAETLENKNNNIQLKQESLYIYFIFLMKELHRNGFVKLSA